MSESLKSLRFAGATLRYWEQGSGEPLLLLHGYPQSHACWLRQARELAKTHRVIAPDWFGWGESGKRLDIAPEYHAEVERLRLLADALGLERFNLAAHDYGGLLALGFAQQHPRRLLRLAILNSRAHQSFTSPGFYRQTAAICRIARQPLLRRLGILLPWHAMHQRDLRRYVPAAFSSEQLERYIGWLRNVEGRRYILHFYRHYELEPRQHLADGLATMQLPLAVIWGERDRYCGPSIGRDLAARVAGAELTLIPQAGHFVMEEAPQPVLDALRRWLQR